MFCTCHVLIGKWEGMDLGLACYWCFISAMKINVVKCWRFIVSKGIKMDILEAKYLRQIWKQVNFLCVLPKWTILAMFHDCLTLVLFICYFRRWLQQGIHRREGRTVGVQRWLGSHRRQQSGSQPVRHLPLWCLPHQAAPQHVSIHWGLNCKARTAQEVFTAVAYIRMLWT